MVALSVGEGALLGVLRGGVLAQKRLDGGQVLRLAGAEGVVGVGLFKFMHVVALAAVPPAGIVTEVGGLVQVIPPAADIGDVQVVPVPLGERRELFGGDAGEVQPLLRGAAMLLQQAERALFGGGVPVFGEGIIKIRLPHIAVAQQQAALRLGKMRVRVLPP